MNLGLLAVVAALAAPAAPAPAAVVYVEQTRRVGAETSHWEDKPELSDSESADGFGPFDGEAFSSLYDEDDEDRATARVTQNSRLENTGLFTSGLLDVRADGEFGRGHSLFDVTFDVLSDVDYSLRYLVDGEGHEIAREAFPNELVLEQVSPSAPTPLFGPADVWELDPDDPESQRTVTGAQTGTLTPGRYRLAFDIRIASIDYRAYYDARYDVALILPEPSASGMAVLAAASALLRRRRRPPVVARDQ